MPLHGHIRLGLVVALFPLVTACADDPGSRATDEISTSAPDSSASPDQPLPASAPAGTGVRVAVPSHCGVLSVTIEERLWLADPPLGDHNPPPAWDENETVGSFVETDAGRAEFYGDGGQRASFRRAPLGAENPNKSCE